MCLAFLYAFLRNPLGTTVLCTSQASASGNKPSPCWASDTCGADLASNIVQASEAPSSPKLQEHQPGQITGDQSRQDVKFSPYVLGKNVNSWELGNLGLGGSVTQSGAH